MKPKNSSAGSVETTIDFHSAEFNHIDDLNDCCGNYQYFEPLDDIITADMRHQMERRRNKAAVDSGEDPPVSLKRDEIKTVEPEVPEAAAPVTIISQGRILIIDTDADRAITCARHLEGLGLTCTLLVVGNEAAASSSWFDRLEFLDVNAVSITGAFGGFSAAITNHGKQRQLTQRFGEKAATFDLVLDLQSLPSFAWHRLPMGYYAPGPHPDNLKKAMAELPEMRGQFIKPQFTALMKKRCIHGRLNKSDCLNCMEACPFGAIESLDKGIFINHHLCQGCGGCSLACPTDAIQMIHPSKEELLCELRRRLEVCPDGDDLLPTLVFSDSETAGENERAKTDKRDQNRLIIFDVEQIGYVGLEMLLAALVYGAGRVIVACDPQNPPNMRKAVERQAQMAHAILNGLGMPRDKVQFVAALPGVNHPEGLAFPFTDPEPLPGGNGTLPDGFSRQNDRRTLVRLATQHLYDNCGAQQPSLPLPAGSPFGAVAVNIDRCTLCTACAVACPSGALSAEGDAPRLLLRESLCHQCGLCEKVCPEGAIRLEPRLLCNPARIEAQVVLHESAPFRCVSCGAPFASPAMIARLEHKLTDHWMYANERQLRRLRMCRTCRTRDALISKDVNRWSR